MLLLFAEDLSSAFLFLILEGFAMNGIQQQTSTSNAEERFLAFMEYFLTGDEESIEVVPNTIRWRNWRKFKPIFSACGEVSGMAVFDFSRAGFYYRVRWYFPESGTYGMIEQHFLTRKPCLYSGTPE